MKLPHPYNTVKTILPMNLQGWYYNKFYLEYLIQQNNVKTIVELGSWLGLSTIHMAKQIPSKGKIFAIDHWKGSVEHQTKQFESIRPLLYEQFLSNVIHEKLTHKIIPWRMTTHEAAVLWKKQKRKADLIYVDASHEEKDVYQDLRDWYPIVKGSGILCGDDWGWGADLPVQKAVKRFAAKNHLEISVSNSWFWVLLE